jgi:hypothetical protein
MPDDVQKILLAVLGPLVGGLVGFYLGLRRDRIQHQRQLSDKLAEAAEAEKRKPKFVLMFDPNNYDCVTPHTFKQHTRISRNAVTISQEEFVHSYVSISVVNSGITPLRNCVGHLTRLQKRGIGQSSWNDVSTNGSLKMVWAFGDSPVEIPPNASKSLNLLLSSQDKRSLDLRVEGGMPQLLSPVFAGAAEFRLTVGVSADGADSKSITICTRWKPETAGRWDEGDLWVEGETVAAAT